MKILITGGNGFIAKSLTEAFQDSYEVASCSRQQLDLLDPDAVGDHLRKSKYDVVIHCATYDAAPFCSPKDPSMVLENNLKMFFHLARCADQFGKMIYFGSGAEFSRPHWKPKMKEDYFDEHVPQDQYGLSKYVMTKHALASRNIYNLRLFGLFGKYDDWRYRFIPNICARAAVGLSIIIKQNRSFDFLYIDDLAAVVDWFLNNDPKHFVYNVCSGRTYDFLTLANNVVEISGHDLGIKVEDQSRGGEYSGDNTLLMHEIKGLSFRPILSSIEDVYCWMKDNKSICKGIRDEFAKT